MKNIQPWIRHTVRTIVIIGASPYGRDPISHKVDEMTMNDIAPILQHVEFTIGTDVEEKSRKPAS